MPTLVHVPVLLDGATGTQLMQRGVSLCPPHGSAAAVDAAPEALARVHADHASAGAQILTTASLCAHAGDPSCIDPLARRAVAIARAAAPASIAIAGSIGPHPATPARAREAYRALARALVHAGCDLLLIETMIDPEHAAIALQAARDAGEACPIWLAIACAGDGRLLGGATIDALLGALDPTELSALLVGCTELQGLEPALASLGPHRHDALWLGAYPNTGHTQGGRHEPDANAASDLVAPLVDLVRAHRLDVVGGCCGTDPAFVASLRSALHPDPGARALAEARLRRALAR